MHWKLLHSTELPEIYLALHNSEREQVLRMLLGLVSKHRVENRGPILRLRRQKSRKKGLTLMSCLQQGLQRIEAAFLNRSQMMRLQRGIANRIWCKTRAVDITTSRASLSSKGQGLTYSTEGNGKEDSTGRLVNGRGTYLIF